MIDFCFIAILSGGETKLVSSFKVEFALIKFT